MPSPFPGMDPYLEAPAVFPDLHGRLITYLSEFLNTILPPPYFTGIASRVWVEMSGRRIEPDVNVLRPTETRNGGAQPGNGEGGGAVAEVMATEPIVLPFEREEVRQAFLEIRAQPGERLVTTIEVLSPANKTAGQGRNLYVQKQDEMLQSQVHFVEMDLLRAGLPTTLAPMGEAVRTAGFFDYHACVRRWDRPDVCLFYPIQLQGRLPVLSIPLLPEDRPAVVDLTAVLGRAYDSGRYHLRVHYRDQPPPPPLHPNQLAWVEETLHAAGLREAPPAAPAP
jgi:uncharacterized protein DUF4058